VRELEASRGSVITVPTYDRSGAPPEAPHDHVSTQPLHTKPMHPQ
jgi:hypothetical protein